MPEPARQPAASEAQAIIDAVSRLHGVQIVGPTQGSPEGAHFAVLPSGQQIVDLKTIADRWAVRPDRIRQAPRLDTPQALIDYVTRFRRPETILYADVGNIEDGPRIVALIDYHDAAGPQPSHVTHRATYPFPLSEQARAWMALSGSMMEQAEFAATLRDRQRDIENPPLDWMAMDAATVAEVCAALNLHDDPGPRDEDGAYLLGQDSAALSDEADRYTPMSAAQKLRRVRFGTAERLARLAVGLEVHATSKVRTRVDIQTGEATAEFSEEHDAREGGERVRVPPFFLLRIPLFDGAPPRLLPVRLYYRKRGQGLAWMVELVEIRRLIRLAAEQVAWQVVESTGCPVYFGWPER